MENTDNTNDSSSDRGDRSAGDRPRGRREYSSQGQYGDRPQTERAKGGPMEVIVDNNIEKAMKVLKRKLIKEGLFKELKSRRFYEKPSIRRKRKTKEAMKKARKEAARTRKNSLLFS